MSEISIAGNLKDLLLGIEMVGTDVQTLGATAAPAIKVSRLMVSGL